MEIVSKETKTMLPKFWRQITAEEFASDFYTFAFKKQKSRSFIYDRNLTPLEKPFLFVKIFKSEYATWKGLGMAICWHGKNDVRFYKFGNPKKWGKEKNIFFIHFYGSENQPKINSKQ